MFLGHNENEEWFVHFGQRGVQFKTVPQPPETCFIMKLNTCKIPQTESLNCKSWKLIVSWRNRPLYTLYFKQPVWRKHKLKMTLFARFKIYLKTLKYIRITWSNKKWIKNKLQVYSHIVGLLINTVQTLFSIPVLAPPKVIKTGTWAVMHFYETKETLTY